MAPKSSEKEEMLNALSKRIFSAMLDDIIFDAALQAHHEVLKGKSICQICQTRCGSVHLPGSLSQSGNGGAAGGGAGPSSRADTPSSEAGKGTGLANGGSANRGGTPNATGTGTPTGNGNKEGTVWLDCVNCQRQIASNRYAPHLASCMGLSSARRGSSTRASSSATGGKPKLPSDAGRSASPASEAGNASDERLNGKGKGKAKTPKRAEESEGSLKRKRPQSPQTSPAKVNKKAKASGSPVSRVKAEPDATGPLTSLYTPSTTSNKSKIPSKLRESSTTSFLERSPTSGSSRSTSPAATPASSFSAATQSPSIVARVIGSHGNSNGLAGGAGRGRGKATGTGPPARRVMSPPRPLPPPSIVHHVSIVPDYGMHDGDETGSSTDTDSD